MLRTTKKLALVGFIAASALLANRASAIPITGQVFITSNESIANVDYGANTVTFVDTDLGIPGNGRVSFRSGSWATLPSGSLINYTDFTYSPLNVVNPIWQTVLPLLASFNLSEISTVVETPGTGLVLKGFGTANLLGFDSTYGAWSFSANSSDGGATFNWSSTDSQVPENGLTAMLVGVGLIGVGVAARAFKKRAKTAA